MTRIALPAFDALTKSRYSALAVTCPATTAARKQTATVLSGARCEALSLGFGGDGRAFDACGLIIGTGDAADRGSSAVFFMWAGLIFLDEPAMRVLWLKSNDLDADRLVLAVVSSKVRGAEELATKATSAAATTLAVWVVEKVATVSVSSAAARAVSTVYEVAVAAVVFETSDLVDDSLTGAVDVGAAATLGGGERGESISCRRGERI